MSEEDALNAAGKNAGSYQVRAISCSPAALRARHLTARVRARGRAALFTPRQVDGSVLGEDDLERPPPAAGRYGTVQ